MTLPGFRARVRAATVLALGFFPHLVSAGALTLPVYFESNTGQAGPQTRFIGRAQGYSLLMGEKALEIEAGRGAAPVWARFAGASKNPAVEALEPLPTRVNYYIGDASHWVSGASCWARVRYKELYPGIELEFYGQDRTIEYDARIAPGADPSRLGFDFGPGTRVRLTAAGDLAISTGSSDVLWRRPVAYQNREGKRGAVTAEFALRGRHLSFHLGEWDRRLPLVIDPTVSFSSYLGGSKDEGARAVAVDGAGNVYLAGSTNSGNLPVTASSYQPDFRGNSDSGPGDAFVAKLNPSGSQLLYITYLGGTASDLATAIAVDAVGNAVVAGSTSSADFPVSSGAYQKKYGGGGGDNSLNPSEEFWPADGDAFVAKFDPAGKLTWSTYLGGSLSDGASGVALDGAGNVFVGGSTLSTNFPATAGSYQTHYGGSIFQSGTTPMGYLPFFTGDAFLAKLDPSGAHVLAATYLGGSADDTALAITLDPKGNVWLAGGTISTNFPVTSGSFQTKFGGASDDNTQFIAKMGDGFVSELSADLSHLLYSTYVGGSRDDAITALAVDSSGYVYLTGVTQSSNFPVTAGAYATSYHGPAAPVGNRPYLLGDAFVAKLNPTTSKMLFSTYLGGSDDDAAGGIAIDAQGNVAIAGMTNSSNFPVSTDALQARLAGSGASVFSGVGDGFVAKFDSSGSKLLYSSFLGGTADDSAMGMGHDATGNVYIAGYTNSPDFPSTAGVVQPKTGGGKDAFLVKMAGLLAGPAPAPVISAVTNGASFTAGSLVPGSIATLFGTNLTSSTGINLASSTPLPTSILSVSVLVNGTPAPLFAVDNVNGQQQINFQAPWEAAGSENASLQVVNDGVAGPVLQVPVVAAQPGIFAYAQGGLTFGAILHANYQLADTANPAAAGETVLIFATGLGATGAHPPTGSAATSAASTMSAPVVKIGGATAKVSYSGLAPFFVGLYQVNAVVPSGLGSGNQPVVLTLGSASNSVLLPVK